MLHELLGHADAGVGHTVDEAYHAGHVARQLLQVDGDASVGLGVLEGVRQDVDEHLVDAQLVGVEVLLLHGIGAEVEVYVLLLDHRLRDVDEVLGHIHDGEHNGREGELAAFHLGNVEDVVDECEQVIARELNLMQAVLDDGWVINVALCDGRQSQNRVHGRADIVGHGREEVALGAICRLGLLRRLVHAHVEPIHEGHVAGEQEEQGAGDPDDQEPVDGASMQAARLEVVQDGPALVRADRRIRYQALLATRVGHEKRPLLRCEPLLELTDACGINLVVRFIELYEVVVLVFVALDDVVAVAINERDFGILVSVDGEYPFFLKLLGGNDAQKDRLTPLRRVTGIHKQDPAAKRQRLDAAHGVGVRARDVDGTVLPHQPVGSYGKADCFVRHGVVVFCADLGSRREPLKRTVVRKNNVRGVVGRRVGRPDKRHRFVDRQSFVVDVARPYVADVLLAFEVVGRHLLHGDGGCLELGHLGSERLIGRSLRVQQDEAYDSEHDGNVYQDYQISLVRCLHLGPFPHEYARIISCFV